MVSNSHSLFTNSYSPNNTPLAKTTSKTYLGVELSNNLKWNKHVDHITDKGNRSLGFIRRNFNRYTEDSKSLAYRSLVRPSLEYCEAVWEPYANDLIYQLQAVQLRSSSFVKTVLLQCY